MSIKEERVRALTKLYYSNPKIQQALLQFSSNREVVPRYFEGFGRRPDTLQYVSDIMGLVNKGATSFHASEELWTDPLALMSEMNQEQMNSLRASWDLLIDIDSPFLDCSKIAADLIIKALEQHGVKHYGLKFSGSKGFHIIVSGKAFPAEYSGSEMRKMFPEWPRAIAEYLMQYIQGDYNRKAAEILTNFEAIERRTNVSKEELLEVFCLQCNRPAKKGVLVKLQCPICTTTISRRDVVLTKRKLRCVNTGCPGILETVDIAEYQYCEQCKDPDNEKLPLASDKYPSLFEQVKGVSAAKVAALDLVLVAPRHLFRMPYSLHEKTALASVVLKKEELHEFTPQQANPLSVSIQPYLPLNEPEEARRLLAAALDWKRTKQAADEVYEKKKYAGAYEPIDTTGISETMFPSPIKKLLAGLKEGKKRGLFILITFLRSLNFTPEYIAGTVSDWNKKNEPPLREGYIKSQLEWHFRQKRKILPPNYDNQSFYLDLNLLDKKPDVKNPIVDVMRTLRKKRSNV